MLNKILAATPAIALSVFSSVPGLATPVPHPSQGQYIRYEIELASFFVGENASPHNGVYFRKTNVERRDDGRLACMAIFDSSLKDHLFYKFKIAMIMHKGDEKRINAEMAYDFAVTASAVNNFCDRYRPQLMDWIESLGK